MVTMTDDDKTGEAGRGPLDGIRILELASFVSGPFATMMLCDLGAEVIKVEPPPKGDPMRGLGRHETGLSPLFVNTNRGKRSITLDLKEPTAQRELHALLATADILVCNWRPAVAARLGLIDAELAVEFLRLIRVYVSGWGPDGPLADSPAFDSVVQARVGLTDTQGDGNKPALVNTLVVDKLAAAMVGQATLAGLLARERLGVAERIDVAMLDAAAYLNFPDAMANRTFVDRQPVEARSVLSTNRPLETKNGWIIVVPVTAGQMRRACSAIGREELGAELLALSDASNLISRFFDEIEVSTRTDTTDHWLEAFAHFDVPAAPCLTLDEHLDDPQTRHNKLYAITQWPEWPELGAMRDVRYPATFSTWGHLRTRSGPPERA
jgi:CoA:oxalate CoA-transferase